MAFVILLLFTRDDLLAIYGHEKYFSPARRAREHHLHLSPKNGTIQTVSLRCFCLPHFHLSLLVSLSSQPPSSSSPPQSLRPPRRSHPPPSALLRWCSRAMTTTSEAASPSSMPFFPGAWPDTSESGHTVLDDTSSVVSAADVGDVHNSVSSTPESKHTQVYTIHVGGESEAASGDVAMCDRVSDIHVTDAIPSHSKSDEGVNNIHEMTSPMSASASHDSCVSASSASTSS